MPDRSVPDRSVHRRSIGEFDGIVQFQLRHAQQGYNVHLRLLGQRRQWFRWFQQPPGWHQGAGGIGGEAEQRSRRLSTISTRCCSLTSPRRSRRNPFSMRLRLCYTNPPRIRFYPIWGTPHPVLFRTVQLLGILTMRINPQAYEYHHNFHPWVFKGIISTGNVCALTPNLVGPRTHQG